MKKCCFLLLTLSSLITIAQPPAGTVLITGTDFTPKTIDPARTVYSEAEIEYYGAMPTPLSEVLPYDTAEFSTKFQYGITDNPINLNPDYFLDQQNGFMLTYSAVEYENAINPPVFIYSIYDLEPNSIVHISIDYCSPLDIAKTNQAPIWISPTADMTFKLSYLDELGVFRTRYDQEFVNPGQCNTLEITGLSDDNGSFLVSFSPSSTGMFKSQLSFDKIEVYGKLQPRIFCDNGTSLCVGEISTFQTKTAIAGDYTWSVSEDGGAWTEFSTSKTATFTPTAEGNYQFKCSIQIGAETFTSAVFETEALACCPTGTHVKTVYFDDFGTTDPADPTVFYVWDYSDIVNPVLVKEQTATPYRRELAPDQAPVGFDFSEERGVDKGQYTVASNFNTTLFDGWSHAIGGNKDALQNYDRSNTKEGAALLLHPNTTDQGPGTVLYERTIDNLCAGMPINFEMWINRFTEAANGVSVQAEITDLGSPGIHYTSLGEVQGGLGIIVDWVPIRQSFDLVGTAITLKITNEAPIQNNRAGNDIVIDDIKIRTCSTPKISLYFDKTELSEKRDICNDAFNLFSVYSDGLSEYYDNAPLFLFQYSTKPINQSSWANIDAPSTSPDFSVADFLGSAPFKDLGLDAGTNIYFRVVAAMQDEFTDTQNFQGSGNEANPNDPCKNYSVSDYIVATVECATCKRVDFSGLKLTIPQDTILCNTSIGRNSTTITPQVLELKPDSIKYQYSYVSPSTGIGTPISMEMLGSDGFESLAVNYKKPGIYTIKIWDYKTPIAEAGSCILYDSILIDTVPSPTFSMEGSDTICSGETANDLSIHLTGSGPWQFSLSDNNGLPVEYSATESPFAIPVPPSASGQHTFKIITMQDKYCTATDFTDSVTVALKPSPELVFAPMPDICTDTAGSRDISKNVTVNGSASAAVLFSDTEGAVSSAGIFTPMAVTSAKNIEITATYTNEYACTATAKETITVQPELDVTFDLDPYYCSYDTIDLAQAVSVQGGTFTVSPADITITDNLVIVADMKPWKEYTFTYHYKNTGCEVVITAFAINTWISEPYPTTPFSIVGANAETVTATISAKRNTTGMPANEILELYWIDPDGNLLTEHDEDLTISYPATETNVFTYKAYQTNGSCFSDTAEIPIVISTCGATSPNTAEGYFCNTDEQKEIILTGYKDGEVAWLPDSVGQYGFSNKKYSDIAIKSDSFTLEETEANDYVYYAATWDPLNYCWSEPVKVTFHVFDEPTASITMSDDEAILCWNDDSEHSVTVEPAPNAANGISGHFTIDGNTADLSFVPSELFGAGTADQTVMLEYSATILIDSASGKTCSTHPSNIATKTLTIEYVPTPTVDNVDGALGSPLVLRLKAIGTPDAKAFKWMKTDTKPYKFEPSEGEKGERYDVVGDEPITSPTAMSAYVVEESIHGCLSAPAKGTLSLHVCPHQQPEFNLQANRAAELIAFDECSATAGLNTPAIEISQSTLSMHSNSAEYIWQDSDGNTLATAESFVPAELSVGIHELQAYVVDIDPMTGQNCASLHASVKYEIFAMPEPHIDVPKTDICIYEESVVLTATNGGSALTSGTAIFKHSGIFVDETTEYTIVPKDFGAGRRTFTVEYTDVNGCSAVSEPVTLNFLEVVSPSFALAPAPLIVEMDTNTEGKKIYTFLGTEPDGITLLWYLDNPGDESDMKNRTPDKSGSSFDYVLNPQPIADYSDIGYSDTHTVYATYLDEFGCYSSPVGYSIDAMNCPVPRPEFVTDSVIAVCDYDNGNKISPIKVKPASNQKWISAPDPNITIEYSTDGGNTFLNYTEETGYTPAATLNDLENHQVMFRAVSSLYGCESAEVIGGYALLQTKTPTIVTNNIAFCNNEAGTKNLSIQAESDYSVVWSEGGIVNPNVIGNEYEVSANAGTGTHSVWAKLLMSTGSQCGSDSVELNYTVHPAIPDPAIIKDDVTTCATPLDNSANPEQASFPDPDKMYSVEASSSANDSLTWFTDSSATNQFMNAEGGIATVYEDDKDVTLYPGVTSYLYVQASRSFDDKTCFSNVSRATILPLDGPECQLNVSISDKLSRQLVSYHMWVYTIDGKLVYYSDHLQEGYPLNFWNGKDRNGISLPSGAYVWKVDATFDDGTKWKGYEDINGLTKPSGTVVLP